MEPIPFEYSNTTYAKDQPQYKPLPAYKSPEGIVTTCWKFSWRERLRVLFRGRMFLTLTTFNQPLQPIFPSTDINDHLKATT